MSIMCPPMVTSLSSVRLNDVPRDDRSRHLKCAGWSEIIINRGGGANAGELLGLTVPTKVTRPMSTIDGRP